MDDNLDQDKDGNERYTTEIVANVLRSLDRRESSGRGSFGSDFPGIQDEMKSSSPSTFSSPSTPQPSQTVQDSPPEDDDLPF